MENCKKSGKSQGILRWMISGNPVCEITISFQDKPLEPGLRLLPVFYAFTIAVNLFSIFYKGSECKFTSLLFETGCIYMYSDRKLDDCYSLEYILNNSVSFCDKGFYIVYTILILLWPRGDACYKRGAYVNPTE